MSDQAHDALPSPAAEAGASVSRRILVVSVEVAARDRDAGSQRLFRILELLAAEGHRVTYVCSDGFGRDRSVAELTGLGIDVFPVDLGRMGPSRPAEVAPLNLERLLTRERFDLAILSFYYVAERYLPAIRALSPFTPVVIDTVDVHHVRERRGAELRGDGVALAASETTRRREEAIYRRADALIAVSKPDAAALSELAPEVPCFEIATVHSSTDDTPGFADRSGLIFVGGFAHSPNPDAVMHFHRHAWPLVRSALPGAQLTVVGADPPPVVRSLAPNVTVTGWVPEVAPYLDAARVSIAPLRFGAGVKGKIAEALSRGLPVVTTSIGAEGMDLRDGEHVLVADEPDRFAQAVVRLHEDVQLWKHLRSAGRAHVEARLGAAAALAELRRMLAGLCRTRYTLHAAAESALVPAAVRGYAAAFEPSAATTLLLTVPDSERARAVYEQAERTLTVDGIDPEAVADIQIASLAAEAVLPAGTVRVVPPGPCVPEHSSIQVDAPAERWRELALASSRAASASTVRASRPQVAVLLHALRDPRTLAAQLEAMRPAQLSADTELVVVADAPTQEMVAILDDLKRTDGVRLVRCSARMSRHRAWQLGAHATSAPVVIGCSALATLRPGASIALTAAIAEGAALAGPVIDGAAGLRRDPDGSLWPRARHDDGPLDALSLDCVAARTELMRAGLPVGAMGEGFAELQLARWAAAHGGIALAFDAHAELLPAPSATIIICTRDRPDELEGCVRLLLAGSADDIVIVDNGSSDDGLAVAARLADSSHGRVRLVHETRQGLSHARNAGAAAARHDLLLYLDDDARPSSGWLSHMAWALSRPGVVGVGGPICALWPEGRVGGWPGPRLEPLLSLLDLGDGERVLTPPDPIAYGANWGVRRSALIEVGGFDPGFGYGPGSRLGGEEVSVAWRLHDRGLGECVYAPGGAVGHRIAPDRLDDDFLLERAVRVGVERPLHLRARGRATPEQLLSSARNAAQALTQLVAAPGQRHAGPHTMEEMLRLVHDAPHTLADRVWAAVCLGELAAAAALLGESEVLLDDLRLAISGQELLHGVISTPVAAGPVR